MNSFFYRAPLVTASEKYEYITYMLDLLKDSFNCFLLSLIEKHLNQPLIYYNLSFLIEKSFWNLSSLLHHLTNVLNFFLFISTFSVFLNEHFFRWLVYKSLLSTFSLLTNYIMWSYNIFFCIQLLHMLFMLLVFQGPGSGSRFQKQPNFTPYISLHWRKNVKIKAKFINYITSVCFFSFFTPKRKKIERKTFFCKISCNTQNVVNT